MDISKQKFFNDNEIEKLVVLKIYSEIDLKLDLMGEDTSEIIEGYDLW